MEEAPENGKESSHTAHANSSREDTHILEMVGDGRKAFRSTERNVTVWTRFYWFRIGSSCVLFERRDETLVSQ